MPDTVGVKAIALVYVPSADGPTAIVLMPDTVGGPLSIVLKSVVERGVRRWSGRGDERQQH